MRTKNEILAEINRTIPTVTQQAGWRKWDTQEWVQPEPIEFDVPVYDKETKLIAKLLLDIRELLLQDKN